MLIWAKYASQNELFSLIVYLLFTGTALSTPPGTDQQILQFYERFVWVPVTLFNTVSLSLQ